MRYLIGIAAVVGSFLVANATLGNERIRHYKLLSPADPKVQTEPKQLTKVQNNAISIMIAFGAAVTVWRLLVMSQDIINVLKLSIALVCLTGSACVDYIEHRIPNLFSGALALSSVLLLMAGVFTEQDGAMAYVFSSVFAAAASSMCLILCSFLSHQGIGMGDIKLVAALALAGGVYVVGGTLFFSIMICALVAGCLLLTKKKTMKEAIPFGPFILLGYMLTICIVKF